MAAKPRARLAGGLPDSEVAGRAGAVAERFVSIAVMIWGDGGDVERRSSLFRPLSGVKMTVILDNTFALL
jgi:hypothetical protein